MTYFSELEEGLAPPTLTGLTPNVWRGIERGDNDANTNQGIVETSRIKLSSDY